MTAELLEFSREIATDSVGDDGLSISIDATPEERLSLAERFDLVSLERLGAEITLTPENNGQWIRLKGTFSALIRQNCVVTLDPLENNIDGTLERVFDTTLREEAAAEGDPEEDFEFDGVDPPDPAAEGSIDIGEAVAEQLALEIDLFPRKPGVSYTDYTTGPEGSGATPAENGGNQGKSGPFAALEGLKKKLK